VTPFVLAGFLARLLAGHLAGLKIKQQDFLSDQRNIFSFAFNKNVCSLFLVLFGPNEIQNFGLVNFGLIVLAIFGLIFVIRHTNTTLVTRGSAALCTLVTWVVLNASRDGFFNPLKPNSQDYTNTSFFV
jgi:hypothetical protein